MALQPASTAAQPSPTVLRKTYQHAQKDGSMVLKVCYCCNGCQTEVQGIKAYVKHMSEVHNLKTDVPEKEENLCDITLLRFPNGEGKLVCPMCAEQFEETDMQKLQEHAAMEHPDFWKQYHCSHYKKAADGQYYYVCDFCEMHFSSADQCARHVASQHGEVWTMRDAETSQTSEIFDYLHQDRFDASISFASHQCLNQRMHLVSLGSFCGVKFSMQRMGLGSSHMPFDWIRSSVKGVTDFVRTGFQGYFSVSTQKKIESASVHLYRSTKHCFFHDDITLQAVQEKLQRRVSRFLALSQSTKDLLFVRSGCSTAELQGIDDLYAALHDRFAADCRRVLLVVIVDGQPARQGPIVHETIPSIVFYLQPFDPDAMSPDGSAYCHAIASAADLALQVPEGSLASVGFGVPSETTMRLGSSVHTKPWNAGLVAQFDGISYPCFDDDGAQLIDLSYS